MPLEATPMSYVSYDKKNDNGGRANLWGGTSATYITVLKLDMIRELKVKHIHNVSLKIHYESCSLFLVHPICYLPFIYIADLRVRAV
jgi:phosphatidylserine synthase